MLNENRYSRDDVEGILFLDSFWKLYFPNDPRNPIDIYEDFRHSSFNVPFYPVTGCILRYMDDLKGKDDTNS